MKVYSNSFYGSNLWDLGGDRAKQVYTAWNTAVKLAWGCPQQTRTYFLQNFLNCGYTSARVDMLARFAKFFTSLRNSASHEVQVLSRLVARDVRSVTGQNLTLIKEITNLNPWSLSYRKLKTKLIQSEHVEVPAQDSWRLPYLCSLLSQRGMVHNLALEQEEQALTALIDSLVIN